MVETRAQHMTLDEFMQRYSDEGPFEVIEGEIVPVAPQNTQSGMVAGELYLALATYVKAQKLGQVFIEVPFTLTADSQWVKGSRVPDVMFITAERLAKLAEANPDWKTKPLVLVPDLVAEVSSPTDLHTQIQQKVARYLADGVRVVWLIEPDGRTVTIYTPGSKQLTHLTAEDTLTGGEIVPGFAVAVADLFGSP